MTKNLIVVYRCHLQSEEGIEASTNNSLIRTHAIRRVHENIDKTLKVANAEAKILQGPHENLEGYLEAVEQLRSNIRLFFFTKNKGYKSSDWVLSHANSLLSKAISKLENEFKQLLSSYRNVLKKFEYESD
ncbi:exocyst complex component EXO70A1-like isoform X5 [Rutidosis leptorrhynchoides]|uniref:exocyst complex component EXO70A1-like isoform X5 n=1 Tax=Rutidosis leptorrhynchoides TaxID=125765 RepID=UPI003A9A23A0